MPVHTEYGPARKLAGMIGKGIGVIEIGSCIVGEGAEDSHLEKIREILDSEMSNSVRSQTVHTDMDDEFHRIPRRI